MTALKMNAGDSLVRACARAFESCSKGRDREHATASRLNFAVGPLSSGVENLNVFELCRIVETRNGFSSLVFSRITCRREHDCHRSAPVPLYRALADISVDRRFQQRQQIGFHSE